MKMSRFRIAAPVVFGFFLLCVGTVFVAAAPAKAQCLAQEECDTLKAQIKASKQEARKLKQQIRELREKMRGLEHGSPEQRQLREQLRALRKDNRERRREIRPTVHKFREGCRRC